MNYDILSELTESQRSAVLHKNGPMLVLAGPGSGKTRVITRRIAFLISEGIPPQHILGLTFTNKAAGEMKARLLKMNVSVGSTLCTFHSLCVRVLREFATRAGLPANFSIYDQADQKAVLRDILKERNIDLQRCPPALILRRIGSLKNGLAQASGPFARSADSTLPPALFREIQDAYKQRLEAAQALDFDDLLVRTALLLEGDNDLRTRLGQRYEYILVDEYQDTNTCQYRIARDLSRDHGNLFVTGDPDQSIYGWRGADIGNILAFEKDFPGAPVIRLEENFRSTPQVLMLADDLIKANTRRKAKRLIARNPEGRLPRLYRYRDETEEALGAAAWIRWIREEFGVDFKQIALFYRTNAMSRVLEESLIRAHIPYQIVKGLEFLERREVKDMLAYLRVLVNPADKVSLLRIINRPARGIGETTLGKIVGLGRTSGRTMWSVLQSTGEIPGIAPATSDRLIKFVGRIEGLRRTLPSPVADIMKAVYENSGLKDALRTEKNTDAEENVEELINSAAEFDAEFSSEGGLNLYLQQTALMSDSDAYEKESGAVSLMTLHTAKGLEFEAVLIIGIEDGIIPHARSQEGGRDLEEERRLLFVGITRARKFLALSYTQIRTLYGSAQPSVISPFLRDLPGMEIVMAPFLNRGFESGQSSVSEAPRPTGFSSQVPDEAGRIGDTTYRIGQRVRHPSIGLGRIEQIIPDGERSRVVVQFETGARLTLVLKFARLETQE